MSDGLTHAAMCFVSINGRPMVEFRFRPVGNNGAGKIPKGKILVMRKPLDADPEDDEELEEELIDDDGSPEAFCPECAAGGHDPDEALRSMQLFRQPDGRKLGRNDPCPCGSGRKFKRCCLR